MKKEYNSEIRKMTKNYYITSRHLNVGDIVIISPLSEIKLLVIHEQEVYESVVLEKEVPSILDKSKHVKFF